MLTANVAGFFFRSRFDYNNAVTFETTTDTFLQYCATEERVHCIDELQENSICCAQPDNPHLAETTAKCMRDYKYCTNGATS